MKYLVKGNNMDVYKINCEWDIGQEDMLWKSFDLAKLWAREALKDLEIEESFEECEDECLISIECIEVITRKP